MKEKYTKPDVEITRFEAHDVITASSAGNMIQSVYEMIDKENHTGEVFDNMIK